MLSFCERSCIQLREEPCLTAAVTARYRAEHGDALSRLLAHARHHDLSVMARAQTSDGLPPDRLESILLQSGRPLLIAASIPPKSLLDKVMLCWNGTAHAARAVSAALPLLSTARRVVVASVNEGDGHNDAGASMVVEELQWHGIEAACQVADRGGLSTAARLRRLAADTGATMLVMGSYGRHRTHEFLFGGCTQAALEGADVPVVLAH